MSHLAPNTASHCHFVNARYSGDLVAEIRSNAASITGAIRIIASDRNDWRLVVEDGKTYATYTTRYGTLTVTGSYMYRYDLDPLNIDVASLAPGEVLYDEIIVKTRADSLARGPVISIRIVGAGA